MARMYYAPVNITAAIAAQIDIFELLAGSGKDVELHEIILDQTSEVTDAQEEMLELVLKRVTGAPTSGSGGGTSSPVPCMPNDTATGATVETGNTTKLTGGTSVDVWRRAWNVRVDFIWTPTPEGRVGIDAATRAVLELVTTPADSITKIVGHILFAEHI